jgi:hypothetical protein
MEKLRKVPNRQRHGLLPVPGKWAYILMDQLNVRMDGTLGKAGILQTEKY